MQERNSNGLLGGESKSKIIETQELRIRGHLLRWSDTAIQISNISMVSTANLPLPAFPWLALLLILGGLGMLSSRDTLIIAFPCFIIAGVLIYFWRKKCATLKDMKYLHIFLNSGYRYSFLFTNRDFMNQVLQVFANIFEQGSAGDTNIVINARGNEIRENGSVVQVVERR